MNSTGLLPLADINYLLSYFKDGKGDVKGLLKAIGGVYNFLIDLVPDTSVKVDLNQFTAHSAPLTNEEVIEKLESLKEFNAKAEGLPAWVIPVLLKLLDLASLFLRS